MAADLRPTGRQLARARRRAGFTQVALAAQLGVTGQRICSLEGTARVTLKASARYTRALDELLAGRENR